jgi:hypothetical protein
MIKVSFVAAVQTTEDSTPVVACFARIPFTKETVEACAKKALTPSAQVLSDGLDCFRGVTASGAAHSATAMNGGTVGKWRNTLHSAP